MQTLRFPQKRNTANGPLILSAIFTPRAFQNTSTLKLSYTLLLFTVTGSMGFKKKMEMAIFTWHNNPCSTNRDLLWVQI